jgi:hypothetical protein
MAPGSARKKAPRSARKATAGASFGASSPVASSGFPAGASLFPGGQGTPFTFREGSPMDWSPFEAATAAPFQSVENSFQSSITRCVPFSPVRLLLPSSLKCLTHHPASNVLEEGQVLMYGALAERMGRGCWHMQGVRQWACRQARRQAEVRRQGGA